MKPLGAEFGATPAADHLFKTRGDADILDKAKVALFYQVKAQLLFQCKRGRPDTHTAVSFLCTCIKQPDNDNLKKLIRAMKYLRQTKSLKLTLEADHLSRMSGTTMVPLPYMMSCRAIQAHICHSEKE